MNRIILLIIGIVLNAFAGTLNVLIFMHSHNPSNLIGIGNFAMVIWLITKLK